MSKLREYCQSKGISARELARRLGCPRSTVYITFRRGLRRNSPAAKRYATALTCVLYDIAEVVEPLKVAPVDTNSWDRDALLILFNVLVGDTRGSFRRLPKDFKYKP